MSTPPTVWDGVLRRLRTELPEFVLETWIAPLHVRTGDDRLLLVAPSELRRKRIEVRFLPLIRRCASLEAGRDIEVIVELAAPEATPPAPAPAAATKEQRSEAPPKTSARLSTHSMPTRRPHTAPAQPELPYTFESFVVGPANALAREASLAVARSRQPGVSPLLLVGPSGTGKSHLARAVSAEARACGLPRTVYASAESFTSGLTSSIHTRQTSSFKRRFRDECDLLIIEDIQFLEGKVATQLELFHTIEHLRLVGKSVVLTGNRLPRDLPRLDARLGSEMASGLVALLEPPDSQLRRQILRTKAARGGIRLPDDCLDRLVENVLGSVRDLEGVLRQLVASSTLMSRPIDLALTDEALHKVIAPDAGLEELDLVGVIDAVAAFFNLSPRELASRSRRHAVLIPRQLAMYLCRRYTDASLTEIGQALGRDHPSVRNAIDKVEREILERAPLRYQVEALAARIESASKRAGSAINRRD